MIVATYKWTIDRYHEAVEAGIFRGQAVELLQGALIEMSPEGVPHAGLSSDSADDLRELLGDRAKVREAKPITLPNASEPKPDIAIVRPLGTVYRIEHHPYPEDIFWVIEYANTSLEKDLNLKSAIYAEVGICEYWVVNLKARELIVFRDPVNGEYISRECLNDGIICPLSFSDIEVSVSRLIG
jgi:Uma2 family endonuclease